MVGGRGSGVGELPASPPGGERAQVCGTEPALGLPHLCILVEMFPPLFGRGCRKPSNSVLSLLPLSVQ